MINSRTIFLTAACCISVAVLATQTAPGLISSHVRFLQEAKTLTGKVTVMPVGGSPRTLTFNYMKPNFFKIETETGYTVCDGKDVYSYTKSTNKYTVEPATEALINDKVGMSDVWAWASFFNNAQFKENTAKAGAKRNLKGTAVTGVDLEWQKPAPGKATLFVDDKTGYAKGCSVTNGDDELIVIADELKLPDALSQNIFTFSAPQGATKVEAVVAPKAGFAQIQAILTQNCMPCHSSSSQKGGVDLSSYEAMTGNPEAVTPGNPDASGIYTATKGNRPSMPKGRSPLNAGQVQQIYDWIKAGAKKE